MAATRLRKPLPPLNPANFFSIENPNYELKILQQPLFARESNNSKRLLHPCPVISLTVSKNKSESSNNANITTTTASAIDKTDFFNLVDNPYKRLKTEAKAEVPIIKETINITNHTLAGYFIRVSAIEIFDNEHALADSTNIKSNPHFSPEISEELLIGNKLATGYSFHIPAAAKSSQLSQFDSLSSESLSKVASNPTRIDDIDNRIIFIFNDLGLVKRGDFKLRFELYKIEFFNYINLNEYKPSNNNSKNDRIPLISKIQSITSDDFTVYGSRQFYKLENQTVFNELLKVESDQKLKNDKCLKYLRESKFIKELELDPPTNPSNNRKESATSNHTSSNGSNNKKNIKKKNSNTNDDSNHSSDDRMSIQRLLSF